MGHAGTLTQQPVKKPCFPSILVNQPLPIYLSITSIDAHVQLPSASLNHAPPRMAQVKLNSVIHCQLIIFNPPSRYPAGRCGVSRDYSVDLTRKAVRSAISFSI